MLKRFGFYTLMAVFTVASLNLVGCDEETEKVPAEKTEQKTTAVETDTGKTLTQEPKEKKVETKKVKLRTNMGDIVIELNEEAAPVTAKNFLRYTEEGFYDETIFHRVISGFMIQGGGFTADMQKKQTHEPIINEAANGLKNTRGAVAMARTNNPNSATSQFFINHKDNDFLNYAGAQNPGYAVFGKVVEGMDAVDAIAAVKTTRKNSYADVPAEPVVIKSAKVVSDGQQQK